MSIEYEQACYLAMAIYKRRYMTQSPHFELCPDTVGVITQIDNMVAGLFSDLEAVKDAVGGEPVGYQYLYQHNGSPVWRDEPSGWNGQQPADHRTLYTRPQASAAVPEGTAEVLSDLLCLIDNNLKFGCVPMAYIRAKALYRFLAASQPEVKS